MAELRAHAKGQAKARKAAGWGQAPQLCPLTHLSAITITSTGRLASEPPVSCTTCLSTEVLVAASRGLTQVVITVLPAQRRGKDRSNPTVFPLGGSVLFHQDTHNWRDSQKKDISVCVN